MTSTQALALIEPNSPSGKDGQKKNEKYTYRTREPSLAVLFPQQPGKWTTDDLNLNSIGFSVWKKKDILCIQNNHSGVCIQTIIKGNFSDKIKFGDQINVNYIAWYTNSRDTSLMDSPSSAKK